LFAAFVQAFRDLIETISNAGLAVGSRAGETLFYLAGEPGCCLLCASDRLGAVRD
jgi:hypothetical protein